MEDQNAHFADLLDASDLTDVQKAEFLTALDTGDDRAGTDGLRLHFDGYCKGIVSRMRPPPARQVAAAS